MSGWIKLDRKILDHWLMQDSNKFHAWAVMLMSVNYTDSKCIIDDELVICNRGSAVFSLGTWANKFGGKWTSKKVRSFFNILEKDKMILYKGLRKTSHLTICNYDTYNSSGNTEGTQKEHRRNTEGTQKDTSKEREERKERKEGKEHIKTTKKTIEQRKDIFMDEVREAWNSKGGATWMTVIGMNEFFEYWSEHGSCDNKMRKEKEKTFGITRRLSTWIKSDYNKNCTPVNNDDLYCKEAF